VLGHGVLELFHGVRIARGRPLVTAAVRLRWTGWQRGLTRRRGGTQAGEVLFSVHRHFLFRAATAAVRCRRRRSRSRLVPVGDFPFVRFPFFVARLLRLYSYTIVVIVVVAVVIIVVVVQLKR